MAWRENQASRLKNCVKWRSLEARAACVVALIAALVCGIAAAQSRFVLLTVLAASAEVPLALTADVRLNVYVTCDGGDIAGAHLCFAVKQGIITSVDLQLVDDRTARTGIAVHLVSVDASPPGLPKGVTSAVSVTYAFFGGPIEYYDSAQIFLVGANKVSDIASAILSAVERRTAKLSGQAE